MLLAADGSDPQRQKDIYATIQANADEAGWYSSPGGLGYVLSTELGLVPGDSFQPQGFRARTDFLAALNGAIGGGHAPCALVKGGEHWTIILELEVDQGAGGNPVLRGVHFHDPAAPSFFTRQHRVDDTCGRGGYSATAHDHEPAEVWLRDYATPNAVGQMWLDQHVLVTREGVQPAVLLEPEEEEREQKGQPASPDAVAGAAVAGLKAHRLFEHPYWSSALRQTQPGSPFLVRDLRNGARAYYVTPMERNGTARADGQVRWPAAVIVSAHGLEYWRATTIGPQGREDVLGPWNARDVQLSRRRRAVVPPVALIDPPVWVWRPCVESMNPFHPFRLATAGGAVVYVDLAGHVHRALHAGTGGA
jgi:hypothetical protein